MYPLIDVPSLGLAAFSDDLGGPVTVGPEPADDAWWPWVLVVLAATVVALGAILFSPDQHPGSAPCPAATCPSTPAAH